MPIRAAGTSMANVQFSDSNHPDGSLLSTIPLPVDRPTSCAFGDTGGGTLFVTTAREGLDEAASPPNQTPDACYVPTISASPGRLQPYLRLSKRVNSDNPADGRGGHGGESAGAQPGPSARTTGRDARGHCGTIITAAVLAAAGDRAHPPARVSILVTLLILLARRGIRRTPGRATGGRAPAELWADVRTALAATWPMVSSPGAAVAHPGAPARRPRHQTPPTSGWWSPLRS